MPTKYNYKTHHIQYKRQQKEQIISFASIIKIGLEVTKTKNKTNELRYYNRKRANVTAIRITKILGRDLRPCFYYIWAWAHSDIHPNIFCGGWQKSVKSRDRRRQDKWSKLAFNLVRLRQRFSNNFTLPKWLMSWIQDPFHQNSAKQTSANRKKDGGNNWQHQLHIIDQKCWGSMIISAVYLIISAHGRLDGSVKGERKKSERKHIQTLDNWQWVLHWQ